MYNILTVAFCKSSGWNNWGLWLGSIFIDQYLLLRVLIELDFCEGVKIIRGLQWNRVWLRDLIILHKCFSKQDHWNSCGSVQEVKIFVLHFTVIILIIEATVFWNADVRNYVIK